MNVPSSETHILRIFFFVLRWKTSDQSGQSVYLHDSANNEQRTVFVGSCFKYELLSMWIVYAINLSWWYLNEIKVATRCNWVQTNSFVPPFWHNNNNNNFHFESLSEESCDLHRLQYFLYSNCECLSSKIRSEWMQFLDHPQITKTSMVLIYFALNYCKDSAKFCADKKAFVNCNLKLKHIFFSFGRRINRMEKNHLFSLLLSL